MAPRPRKRLHDQPVTLDRVARRAGVSTATVSRALNAPGTVSPATRAAVLEAVAELRYVPHGAARALASRRTRTIGAVMPTLKNAIFAACLEALQQRLERDGFVLLAATNEYDPGREAAQVSVLLERGVDGVVLVGSARDPEVYGRLEARRIPFVLTWTNDPRGGYPYVGFDNYAAATRVVRYLLELGHRRFAMIAGITADNDRASERVRGVRDALAARRVPFGPEACIEQPYTIPGGRAAMRSFLLQRRPPTAVICGNDILALGALAECRERGVPVPAAISVVGFDDLELASYVVPALTTIRVLSAEIGALAGDYLLARLAGRAVPAFVELDVELVVRESTGRAAP